MLFIPAPSNTPGAPAVDAGALAFDINQELENYVRDLEASLIALCQTIPATPPASGLWLDTGALSIRFGPEAGLINAAGVLMLTNPAGWSITAPSVAGAVWNNSLSVGIVPGIVPDPLAAPVFLGLISSVQLLALGGGNLPLSDPHNPGQIWNHSNVAAVSL